MSAAAGAEETLAALRDEVRHLSDRAELTALGDRYVAHLHHDRHRDDWFGSVFTDDVQLTFPMGEYKGTAGLAEFREPARTTFERTHHTASNYSVEIDGDRARIRAHLTAVHVRTAAGRGAHFTVGGRYEALAVRTAQRWRINRFLFEPVRHEGQGPQGAPGH